MESLALPLANNLVGRNSPTPKARADMTTVAFGIASVTKVKKVSPSAPLFNSFKENVVIGTSSRVASSEKCMPQLAMSDNPALKFVLRKSLELVACNKFCYVLHTDIQDNVVAEGKIGGS